MATSTYDASFGRNPGAQVNVVLKSGSNNFHGSLYEFYRNAALDARNFFAPGNEPAPKYIRNQFGFSFGGPIRKDRTFFFADYEGTRAREGITRIANVPTLQERSGDFSQNRFGIPRDPSTGQPLPGGVIPSFFIHPVGSAIAALYPLPNRAAPLPTSFRRPHNATIMTASMRGWTTFSPTLPRWFSDTVWRPPIFEPLPAQRSPRFRRYGNEVPRRSQNAMIGLTHVFSPTLVNDTRFAFNRVASAVNQENQGTSDQSRGWPAWNFRQTRAILD